jgi:hypothetical protein
MPALAIVYRSPERADRGMDRAHLYDTATGIRVSFYSGNPGTPFDGEQAHFWPAGTKKIGGKEIDRA